MRNQSRVYNCFCIVPSFRARADSQAPRLVARANFRKKEKNISAMHDYRACHTYKQTPYGDCRIVFVYVSFTSTIIIYHCTGRLYGGSHIRHSAILLNWFSVCAQRSWMWWMGSKKFNVCFSYGWFSTNTNETKKKRCFYWFSALL